MNQEKIGKFIKENRNREKWTQEELAEKLGVSKNAVSKWERGCNLPDACLMPELCKVLEITLNELFCGEYISENNYKEIADHNLYQALENSTFTLQEKITYYREKWQKEHLWQLVLITGIIVGFIIYGFIKDNGMQYIFMIIGVICGIIEHNRMMAYIEKHAYKIEHPKK